MIVILYLTLIVIYATRGVEQGILFSNKGAGAFPWNEHIPIVIVRIGIPVSILLGVIIEDVRIVGFTILSFLPAFWFWHNMLYYYTRHKIDNNVYKDWWKAESTTSSSVSIKAMPFLYRVIGLVISLILITILIVIK